MGWRRRGAAILLFLLGLPFHAFGQGQPVRVVATFSVLADMVKNVGSDSVSVTTLVGPDADIHLYQPTPADARAVAEARLVVSNGLGLEGWLDRLLSTADFKGKVATAADGVKTLTMEDEDQGRASSGGGEMKLVTDPHAWQDLRNGQVYVANIVKALSQIDPAHADAYKRSGDTYRQQLGELDKKVRAEFAVIPRSKRRVITTHDAFQYFGKAYGIEFIAPVGVSTESEPSAGGVAQFIEQVKRERVKALFLENVTNPRFMAQLAKEVGAELGPSLYSDALSRSDEPASTYAKMFEYNTGALKAGMLKN
jgi:zinc/manganese transport system substrate-binding protein